MNEPKVPLPSASPRPEPPTLTVRQAVLADLERLVSLFDAYRQFQGQPADLLAARHFLRERIDHGESVLFLAEDGRSDLGFAQLYPMFSSVSLSRVFVLNDLFVTPAGRRRGVATALLQAVEAHAWALGASRLSLNVALGNPEAQALYTARGWAPDTQFQAFHRHAPRRPAG